MRGWAELCHVVDLGNCACQPIEGGALDLGCFHDSLGAAVGKTAGC